MDYRCAPLIGLWYFLVGRLFAVPVTHVQVWRLAAWVVSGVAFLMHTCYEHFRLSNHPRLLAWHAAVAVAIGALLLAVAGMIRSLWTTSEMRPAWLVALLLWPAFTAIPAFLVSLLVAAVLTPFRPAENGEAYDTERD